MNYNLYNWIFLLHIWQSPSITKMGNSQQESRLEQEPSCCCSVLYMLCIAVYMYRSTMMILTSPLSENGKFLAIIGNKFRKQERTRQKRHWSSTSRAQDFMCCLVWCTKLYRCDCTKISSFTSSLCRVQSGRGKVSVEKLVFRYLQQHTTALLQIAL